MSGKDEILTLGPFQFDKFRVDPQRNIIALGDAEARVEPRVMAVLCRLCADPGVVVSRQTLVNDVWGKQYGGDESLSQAMSSLRKAFRSLESEGSDLLETIPKGGYRTLGRVEPVTAPHGGLPPRTAGQSPGRPKIAKAPIVAASAAALVLIVAIAAFWTRPEKNTDLAAAETLTGSASQPDPAAESKTSENVGLAVLPLVNLTAESDQEYFVDGLSEELLSWLANVEGLRVPGRTTSFHYKGKTQDLRLIGEQLGVQYILNGSVRKSGETLRVTVQLVEADTGFHIWSATYDRELADIFVIQEGIAREVRAAVLGVLPTETLQEPSIDVTVDPKAHEQYLIGRAIWTNRRDPMRAGAHFRKAIVLDPDHALAHAYIAVTTAFGLYNELAFAHQNPNAFREAKESLDRAVALRPNLSNVMFAQGYFAELAQGHPAPSEKRAKAVAFYQRAAEADPNNVEALYASYRFNRNDATNIETLRKILTIDPFMIAARSAYARALADSGEWEEAFAAVDRATEINPGFAGMIGHSLAWQGGDIERAGDYLLAHWRGDNAMDYERASRAALLADLGATDEAAFLLSRETGVESMEVLSRLSAPIFKGDYAAMERMAGAELSRDGAPALVVVSQARATLAQGAPEKALQLILDARPDLARSLDSDSEIEWRARRHSFDLEAMTAALALEAMGRTDDAKRIWHKGESAELSDGHSISPWMPSLKEALFHAALGKEEEAIAALSRAYDNGFRFLYSWSLGENRSFVLDDGLIEKTGYFSSLHGVPEFEAIIARIRAENAEILIRLNEKHGVLDDVRTMMAEARDE